MAEESHKGISRRDMLRAGLAAAGIGVAVEGHEKTNVERKGPELPAYSEYIRQRYQKIEYPKEQKPLTPELQHMLLQISEAQSAMADSLGVPKDGRVNTSSQEGRNGTYDPDDVAQGKLHIWNALRKIYPHLPPDMSDRMLYQVLGHDLPRLLAPYGVLATPVFTPIIDPERDRFAFDESIFSFYRIRRVTADRVHQWDVDLKRDIIFVSGPLQIDGKDINARPVMQMPAQVCYENVVVYEPMLAQEDMVRSADDDEGLKRVGNLPIRKQLQTIVSASSPAEADRWTAVASYANLYAYERTDGRDPDLAAQAVPHETRHVIDAMNPAFVARFYPKSTESAIAVFAQYQSASVHEEINGLLGELRYAPRKVRSVVKLLAGMPGIGEKDFTHDHASVWVRAKLLPILNKNPEQYGIRIDPESAVSRERQMLVQLAEIIKPERAAHYDKAITEIMEEHESRYDQDFSDEYIAANPLLRTKQKKIQAMPIQPICQFLGGMVALAGVAGVWWSQRIAGAAKAKAALTGKKKKKGR